jgi:hypothetical protein
MNIKVEINGQWQEVTPQQLKAMAQQGGIKPDTLVEFNGTVVPASRIKNLFQQQAVESGSSDNTATVQPNETTGSTASEQEQTSNLEIFLKVASKVTAVFFKVIVVLVTVLVIVIRFLVIRIKNRFITKDNITLTGNERQPSLWAKVSTQVIL